MKNDDKVIAKLPKDEKEEIKVLGDKLDLTMGQIVREALQRFRPILIQRVEEKERATGVSGDFVEA